MFVSSGQVEDSCTGLYAVLQLQLCCCFGCNKLGLYSIYKDGATLLLSALRYIAVTQRTDMHARTHARTHSTHSLSFTHTHAHKRPLGRFCKAERPVHCQYRMRLPVCSTYPECTGHT